MGKVKKTEESEAEDGEKIVDNKKKAAVYVRVSTGEQDTGMQEQELREYCERRGWESILYRDHGQSGAKVDRPALNSLLDDLRKRQIDVVLVWSLDRLARSLKQLLTISEECRSLGVDLVSLKQSIDYDLASRQIDVFNFGRGCRIRTRTAAGEGESGDGTGTTGRKKNW